jgi:hypothetical protein
MGLPAPSDVAMSGGAHDLVGVPIGLVGQELGESQPASERNAVAVGAAETFHVPRDDQRCRDSEPAAGDVQRVGRTGAVAGERDPSISLARDAGMEGDADLCTGARS